MKIDPTRKYKPFQPIALHGAATPVWAASILGGLLLLLRPARR